MSAWVRLDPGALQAGVLTPPPSKSDAQRALVLRRARGCSLEDAADERMLPGDVRVLRRGLARLENAVKDEVEIDCEDGGAPFRILLGQAAVLPEANVRFLGSARLGDRPHEPLLTALHKSLSTGGFHLDRGAPWPMRVRGARRCSEARFRISSLESSQYATSLLLAMAWLVAREGRMWTLDLDGPIASRGYLDLTLDWLTRFGYDLCVEGARVEMRKGELPSCLPDVPGDWSSLAYLLILAHSTGSQVRGFDPRAFHPDREIVRVLHDSGLTLMSDDEGTRVHGTFRAGLKVSGAVCPDLLPTAAALACVLPDVSVLSDVSVLRHKESDRLQGIESLVALGGGRTLREGDQLLITPGTARGEMRFDPRGDHRLAMSAAVLSVLQRRPLVLQDPSCVAKSFPGFWRELEKLGVDVDTMTSADGRI